MENIKYNPQEIAEMICKLAAEEGKEVNGKTVEECTEALYQLKAIAENPYNFDFYCTLYGILECLTEKYK